MSHYTTDKVLFFGHTDKIINGTVKNVEFTSIKTYRIYKRKDHSYYVNRLGIERDVRLINGTEGSFWTGV